MMKSNCPWIIVNGALCCKYAKPHFGISATAGSANDESYIKIPQPVEYFPPECHVGSCSDLPDGWTAAKMFQIKRVIIMFISITAVKAPVFFKDLLTLRLKFRRKDQSRHCHHFRIIK